jgi:hypothetical protein
MTLGLEQMTDLRVVVNNVVNLQEKIRQAESMMRYRMHKSFSDLHGGDKLGEIHQVLTVYRDELYVLMESLKELLTLSRTRNSVDVAWRLTIKAQELLWDMMQDDGVPLCQWKFDKTSYVYIQNEDQSSANTLEIDQLHIQNCLDSPPGFTDLLSPFIHDKRVMDFNKMKCLRVFWREMAPVAGIQVVDHFEINMFPISLNVTYEVAKQLMYYIFPERKVKANTQGDDERKKSGGDSSSTHSRDASSATTGEKTASKKGKEVVREKGSPKVVDELLQMQTRSSNNKSFIYIKMPGVQLCLSYKVHLLVLHPGSKREEF